MKPFIAAILLLAAMAVAQEPAINQGRIVFYRLKKDTGKHNYGQPVLSDGQKIGELRKAHYFVLQPVPGPHDYRSSDAATIRLEVQPGETLYVMIDSAIGKFMIHAHPVRVVRDQGREELSSLLYAEPKDRPDSRIMKLPLAPAER